MMTKQNVVSWCDWGTEKDIRLRGGEVKAKYNVEFS